ncbi:imidazole glycerol phosphate synthase subunit HisH [Halobacteriales archaeon SW_7_68_16]|nr:MAG: imidazole glycerol phosphate synthase subunit HisH [Halobacteriales archaeon SW_7_68_16]
MSSGGGDGSTGPSVAIVDYGLGNLRSVGRGLERVGAVPTVVDEADTLPAHDGIVLPGVGAFREGARNAAPFRAALTGAAADGTPILGICLGMQLLLTTSEEGDRTGESTVEGLSLIPGDNVRFRADETPGKVPHMGWNRLRVERSHPIVDGPAATDGGEPIADDGVDDGVGTGRSPPAVGSVDGEYAYFVHSYYAVPDDPKAVVATTDYGASFPSVIGDGTVFGTQFHPEKSGGTGLRILANFAVICGAGVE